MTRTALIERLRGLKGPDRDCDAQIAVMIGGFTERHGQPNSEWVSKGEHHAIVAAPRYTESIDAAVRLVPKGYEWGLDNRRGSDDGKPTIIPRAWVAKFEDESSTPYIGATPAIALCIAALEAGNTE